MTDETKAREILAQLDGGDRVAKLVQALREARERAIDDSERAVMRIDCTGVPYIKNAERKCCATLNHAASVIRQFKEDV